MSRHRPRVAVWKFSSCDGCQLTLLDCEDELLAVAGKVRIASFLEASSAVVEGPYDVSLVEGSITTPGDAERIQQIRRIEVRERRGRCMLSAHRSLARCSIPRWRGGPRARWRCRPGGRRNF